MSDIDFDAGVRVVVACRNAAGEPDFAPVRVQISEEDFDLGDHYDRAIEIAESNGYEGPFVCFDEVEAPEWLLSQFDCWEDIPT